MPYRLNVGAVLFNRRGQILLARRANAPDAEGPSAGWQLPQGGIDGNENPRDAVFRELAEEIGTCNAEIMGEHPDWLTYDFPEWLMNQALRNKYRGQRQKWFALRFLGTDSEIRLDLDPHPEFDAWRWGELHELPGLAVSFKRIIYQTLAKDFAPFVQAATF